MKQKQSSFTLMEIVVAIAILVIVFSFAGVVFKVSIGAYRTAIANAEIMRNLRAITNQFNIDFKGISKGMPVVVWSDRIVFLANGDFQSIRQYPYEDPNGDIFYKTVTGNLASISYGMTKTSKGRPVLSRGQMILTFDDSLLQNPPALELGEYCKMSFYEFRTNARTIFENKEMWAGKNLPPLDLASEQDLVRYMIKGISDFKIEYEQWRDKRDWLSGNGIFVDDGYNIFVVNDDGEFFIKGLGTRALKFSFTLYDSNGIIENGRRFTHIVYIGDW